jgi:hypothetical protein
VDAAATSRQAMARAVRFIGAPSQVRANRTR